eukprot:4992708-Pleurochrysis_carterae.AAC.1
MKNGPVHSKHSIQSTGHSRTHTQTQTQTHTRKSTRVHAYTRTRVHAVPKLHNRTHTHAHTHAHAHAHAHLHAHAHTHLHAHAHAHPPRRRCVAQVNLLMCDSVRDMGLASTAAYSDFICRQAARREVLVDPKFLPSPPLFLLELEAHRGELFYSTALEEFTQVRQRRRRGRRQRRRRRGVASWWVCGVAGDGSRGGREGEQRI